MSKASDLLYSSIDARQTPEWGDFLKKLGWNVEEIGKRQIYIRRVPFLNHSVIKIQHPIGPMPFKKLDQIAKKYNTVYSVIEPHNYKYDKKEYEKNGYEESFFRFAHTATQKIDISKSEDEIFKSFSENARRNIKKAKDMGVLIKPVFFKDEKDDTEFRLFYKLLKNLTKMKKFYVPGYDEFYKKMLSFSDSSFLLFALDPKDKKPVTVVWYAFYDNVISYLQTGIVQKGYELMANYLLVWEGILLGKKLGKRVFDFESVYDPRYPHLNKKWKNYTEFKSRFHGVYIAYPPAYIKFYSPIFKFMYRLSTLFSRKPKLVFLSDINGQIIIDRSYGNKTVFSNGPQSGGEFVRMWRKLISSLSASWRTQISNRSNCLVLGVGGGTVIEEIGKYFPKARITGVEIDPVMVRIAKEQFNVDSKLGSQIIIAEAVSWVKKQTAKKKYDLIIVDLFIGPLNPSSARDLGFLKKIKSLLSANGAILFNSHYQEKKPDEHEAFKKLCGQVFTDVKPVFRYRKNCVLLLK